jgi:hypothetical protein
MRCGIVISTTLRETPNMVASMPPRKSQDSWDAGFKQSPLARQFDSQHHTNVMSMNI